MRWLPGWYADRLHAYADDATRSKCGHMYLDWWHKRPQDAWPDHIRKRMEAGSIPRCKNCERKVGA